MSNAYYDPDDDEYEDDDDATLTAERMRELQRENEELRGRLAAQGDAQAQGPAWSEQAEREWLDRLRRTQSEEEAAALVNERNDALEALHSPPPPAPSFDQAELNARIAAAKSPDEVMALVRAAGMPTAGDR